MESFNCVINRLNKDNARKLRKWESIKMKIVNATRANMFNQNCIREKLRPKTIEDVKLALVAKFIEGVEDRLVSTLRKIKKKIIKIGYHE